MSFNLLIPHIEMIAKYGGHKGISDGALNLFINDVGDLIRSPDMPTISIEFIHLCSNCLDLPIISLLLASRFIKTPWISFELFD